MPRAEIDPAQFCAVAGAALPARAIMPRQIKMMGEMMGFVILRRESHVEVDLQLGACDLDYIVLRCFGRCVNQMQVLFFNIIVY